MLVRHFRRLTGVVGLLVGLALATYTVVWRSQSSGIESPDVLMNLRGRFIIGVPAIAPTLDRPIGPGGFDLALAEWISKDLGFPAKYVPVASRERVSALRSGEVSMVIASFSITDERRSLIDFAGPYFVDSQGLASVGADEVDEAHLAGKKVCSAQDTTASYRMAANKEVLTVVASTTAECLDRLERGEVDAVFGDVTALEWLAARHPHIRISPYPGERTEYYGVGLPDNSPELCAKVTASISAYLRESWEASFRNDLPNVNPAGHRPDPNSMFPCERKDGAK